MPDRLPPLTALRAFEAAARHMSFAMAAAELNVTPAALSFQIKSLEEHLGQPVFRRLNRAVELTEAGRALAPGASQGFEALGRAWRAARRTGDAAKLNVTAGPAITAKWLAPRLFQFAQQHPDIEVRFSASLRVMDFERDEIDVAIRFGYGDDTGLFSQIIHDEWITPVMSPELAGRLPDISDLPRAVLLHQDDTAFMRPAADWGAYFKAAGLGASPEGGPRFSQADHAIDAALAGVGVVLGRVMLVADTVSSGRLVAPYPLALTSDAHYRIVCPEAHIERPQVRAFVDWVMAETSEMPDITGDRRIVHVGEIAAHRG